MRKFEITDEQIKLLDRCSLSAEQALGRRLRQWFPDAFDDEWIEVPSNEIRVSYGSCVPTIVHNGYYIFAINKKPIGGMENESYKIVGRKIYWRKR